jgi:acetoin utilization deacetylase AcuC-like enzyme
VEVVAERLTAAGLLKERLPARDASDGEIERVHRAEYLELVKRETAAQEVPRELSTGDVHVGPASLRVARRAAGGAIAAMEATVGAREPIFALVRPPGHHAESNRGMGFCIFNNAAVAARAYLAAYGGRVLIADFDYHHGNGTQDVIGDGISYLSTHASPAYPGTGFEMERLGQDVVLNVPLPASGIDTEAFVAVWEWLLDRVVPQVRPNVIIASAGFDYVKGDPVGDLGVDVSAASALARAFNRAAAQYSEGRLVYVLEGGYDVNALTSSIEQVIEASDMLATNRSGAAWESIPAPQRTLLGRAELLLQRR